MGVWLWVIALALHHQAPESLPVEPHPCSHLCQGDLCLPSLATGTSTLHVPAPTHQIVAIIVYMVVAQHCQLLILGCDIAHACFLQVSCMFVTGMYARRKQSGLTQSQEINRNHSFLPTPCASRSASDCKPPATMCLHKVITGCC